eukprot:PLAT4275.1.p1 GENE.PLAT4275.1~~PLAT4275.1.p1  ORF type:complete len:176 (+),score=69.57 PLAT4275.1:51-578(+)
MTVRLYHVVGRKVPTEADPSPTIYRMKIFAADPVRAKSRFWYFLHQMYKLKKSTGEVLAVNEIVEKRTQQVKNYGILVRYNSRSGTHNMYKEFRDVTLTGAVERLYSQMAGRHRARKRSVQIVRTTTVASKDLRRPAVIQLAKRKVKFPLLRKIQRVADKNDFKLYHKKRPTTFA